MDLFPITEIYLSAVCSGTMVGTPAVFIRFGGCNKSCVFCSFEHPINQMLTAAEICEIVNSLPLDKNGGLVMFTGGEPSLFNFNDIIEEFEKGKNRYYFGIETNGSMDLMTDLKLDLIDYCVLSPKGAMDKDMERYLKILYEYEGTLDLKLMFPFLPGLSTTVFDDSKIDEQGYGFLNKYIHPILYDDPATDQWIMERTFSEILKMGNGWKIALPFSQQTRMKKNQFSFSYGMN